MICSLSICIHICIHISHPFQVAWKSRAAFITWRRGVWSSSAVRPGSRNFWPLIAACRPPCRRCPSAPRCMAGCLTQKPWSCWRKAMNALQQLGSWIRFGWCDDGNVCQTLSGLKFTRGKTWKITDKDCFKMKWCEQAILNRLNSLNRLGAVASKIQGGCCHCRQDHSSHEEGLGQRGPGASHCYHWLRRLPSPLGDGVWCHAGRHLCAAQCGQHLHPLGRKHGGQLGVLLGCSQHQDGNWAAARLARHVLLKEGLV